MHKRKDRIQGPFLWVDRDPDRIARVRAGKILVSPVGDKNPKPVPSGLIHDWIGAAFIPDARLSDVLSAVRDYDRYKDFYKPTVVDARSLGTDGGCDKYSMRVVNKTNRTKEFEDVLVRSEDQLKEDTEMTFQQIINAGSMSILQMNEHL